MRRILLFLMAMMMIGWSGVVAPKLFAESENVLARVGDRVITQEDLDVLVKRYEAFRKEVLSLDEKKNLLDLLIKSILISIEAEREKIDQNPRVKTELQMLRNEYLTREYIAAKIQPLVTVKDEDVEELMKKNPNLVPRETVTLKEILVKEEKEAEDIYQELKKGADFSKIASERSLAESKARGGSIGTVARGHIHPFLEAVAFELKEREYSKPIKTDDGYKILYLVEKKQPDPEQIKTIEKKVREKVIQLEKNKKIEALVQQKVDELKQKTKVETYIDKLK